MSALTRFALRSALGLSALGLTLAVRDPGAEGDGAEPCWSVQLHMHGSFSEGPASIDSHSWEGSKANVDVLWWSDHDFRIRSYHMLHHHSFDALALPLDDGEAWKPIGEWERKRQKKLARVGKKDGNAHHEIADFGERRGLRVSFTEKGPEFSTSLLELTGDGATLMRSLTAEVELALWVRIASGGPDARGVVTARLSEHAPLEESWVGREDGKFPRHRIRYLLGAEGGAPRVDGQVLEVPVAVPVGAWTQVVLPFSRDMAAAFDDRRPGLMGADNALRRLFVGVEARNGATAEVHFDDLEIRHGRAGPDMYGQQAALIERVGAHYPGVRQFQGLEFSLAVPHLNEFSLSPSPVDYDSMLAELVEREVDLDPLESLGAGLAPLFVEDVHARGGLVSYNHLFGASWETRQERRREDTLAELIATGVHGTDLLEVGYRSRGGHDLADHLWVWDELALAGYSLVGTGVSDSHGSTDGRWETGRNNFVSWVFGPEPTRAALLDGLREGRVFFGDLTQFDGRLDLLSDRGLPMGRVVLTDRSAVRVELGVDGAQPGDRLRVLVSGRELALERLDEPGARSTREIALADEGPTVLRFELLTPGGDPKALSNPIVFVREVPPHTPAQDRLALDVGGLVARDLGGFELRSARFLQVGSGAAVELSGVCRDSAEGLELSLDTAHFGAVREVVLDGLEGGFEVRGDELSLRGLRGSGTVRVLRE